MESERWRMLEERDGERLCVCVALWPACACFTVPSSCGWGRRLGTDGVAIGSASATLQSLSTVPLMYAPCAYNADRSMDPLQSSPMGDGEELGQAAGLASH